MGNNIAEKGKAQMILKKYLGQKYRDVLSRSDNKKHTYFFGPKETSLYIYIENTR